MGTSTCWNTAGSPGTATLRATATVTGGGRSVSLFSPAVRITVTHRVPPDVPAATYARTYSCGNHTPYVWLTFDDYGSATEVRSILFEPLLRRNDVRALMFPSGPGPGRTRHSSRR